MVILEDTETLIRGNRYLDPEFRTSGSSSSTEGDAKSSPLALLVKTCSQIGVDVGTKSLKKGVITTSSSSSSPSSKSSSPLKSKVAYTTKPTPLPPPPPLLSPPFPSSRPSLPLSSVSSSQTSSSNPFLAGLGLSPTTSPPPPPPSSSCQDPLCRDPSCPAFMRQLYASMLSDAALVLQQRRMLDPLPHVCNWMSGSEYCGGRFSTGEELLQHLKSHATDSRLSSSSLRYHPYHRPSQFLHQQIPPPSYNFHPNVLFPSFYSSRLT